MSKSMMALLIAAHNEELVLGRTIQSAIDAGMKPEDIYLVNDSSSDKTTKIARQYLPIQNVCSVVRSGKGLALKKATKKFDLVDRYRWIHIADADGAFATNYFRVMRRDVRVKYGAATGYMKSMPGHHVSQYRVFEYTIGMELHRRFQSMFNVISVIPGPTSCFRSDVLQKVDFANGSLTEDFDVTLQIHRNRLGKIQYVPQAVAYTQDPKTTKEYINQISRWNRGVMQGVIRHRIGKKLTPIDLYLMSQITQNILFLINYLVWIPFLVIKDRGVSIIAVTFLLDVILTFTLTLLVAIRAKRMDVVSAFPYIFFMRFVSLGVFVKSFVEVIVLRRFKIGLSHWENKGRRYIMEDV